MYHAPLLIHPTLRYNAAKQNKKGKANEPVKKFNSLSEAMKVGPALFHRKTSL
jgi:hypothetical protein